MPVIEAASMPWNTSPSSTTAMLRAASTAGARSIAVAPRSTASSSDHGDLELAAELHERLRLADRDAHRLARHLVGGRRAAEVERRHRVPVRSVEVDEPARGEERPQRTADLALDRLPRVGADRCEVPMEVVHGATSRSEPMPRSPPPAPGVVAVLGLVLDLHDRARLEQVRAQVLVELRVAAPEPLQQHRRVLLLLVAVVLEQRPQLGVLRSPSRAGGTSRRPRAPP